MQLTTLVRNNDFLRAYRRGKSYVHPCVVLYVNKNRLGYPRIGITCSKKVGKATVRSRARRVIRHGLYQVLPENLGGYDLVFVARGRTPHIKSTDMAKIIQKQLKTAGLLPCNGGGT